MKVRRSYNLGFVILVAFVIFILFGSLYSIKAIAKEKSYFSTATDAAESKYLTEIKSVLTANEVFKAGVTMTKTTADGVEIDYEVSIHAAEYIYNSISDWDGLMGDLQKVLLEVDNSRVHFSFD